jgi:ADP-ribose pyrophosphatase YjhB (NUDIX family)
MVGVTAVCWTTNGRVLLARHRYWPERTPWALPSGYAQRGEEVSDTIRREVAEEVGVHLEGIRLADLRTGYRLRVEIALDARVADGSMPVPDGREVLEAAFFPPDALPAGVLPRHVELIEASLRRRGGGEREGQ